MIDALELELELLLLVGLEHTHIRLDLLVHFLICRSFGYQATDRPAHQL